jgi:peptide/nickel transport system substrate-binding protein
MKITLQFLLIIFSFTCFAQDDFTVNIHEMGNPDGLNPLTSKAANAKYIQSNLFCRLLEFDKQTFDLIPSLAVATPVAKTITEGKFKGGISISYEIHPQAVWDNGTPVTAADYIFTIKAIKNPKCWSSQIRPYFDFIDDIVIDEKNLKKFTIFCKEPYFRAVESSGVETFIIPEYYYDPQGIMSSLSLADLADSEKLETLSRNPLIIRFAEAFNSSEFQSDKISGCGPYTFEEWNQREKIVLKRKKDWWGDKVVNNEELKAYPDKIVYHTIPDYNIAFVDAKNGKLDLIRRISPHNFFKYLNDPDYKSKFDFISTGQFAYHYIGFNTKVPQLTDLRVRKALAHAVDRDFIINEIFLGKANKINSPVSPEKSYYNSDIKDVEFNLDKAKELLVQAGWKDSDKDGILDKMIEGKLQSLKLKFIYNQGYLIRKQIGEMFRENLAKIQVEIQIEAVNFPELLEKADSRDFEILALAFVKTPGLDDMKQIWHSDSDVEGGANRVGFGSAESDRIIEEMSVEMNTEKLHQQYKKIQKIIADSHSYIFLVEPHELIMVRKTFDYPPFSAVRPGYNERLFQLKK